MARFTVRLDDGSPLAEWVETEAEERERSKAWVVRQAIAAAAGEESVYTDAHRTDAERTDAKRTDTGELRERVEALEAAVYDDNSPEPTDSPSRDRGTPTPQAGETTTHQPESEEMDAFRADLGDYLLEHGPQTEHGRRGVLRCVDELHARGPLTSEELTDLLEEEIGDQYSRRKSMWESVKRHLQDCPGVYETENYQEWDFAGIEAARREF